ncbi:DUF554 domain-containing protein [Bacillota bacterium LX-D]|nr:DUF554 domain-containing protein [Bacillota bacterium LX-D]
MFGTIVNVLAIIAGGLLGKFLGAKFSENISSTVMQAVGLGVLVIGTQMFLATDNIIIIIASLVLGGIAGELLRLEYWLERLGEWLQSIVNKGNKESAFAKAFVTASLVYCVGAMAIMGSLESGLTGSHQTLFAKSILDGISAIIFSSTLGIGVAFSAIPVFIYQGSITLLASWIQPFLTAAVIAAMKATGGVLIFAIGLNILKIKSVPVGNLLPSIIFACLFAYFA